MVKPQPASNYNHFFLKLTSLLSYHITTKNTTNKTKQQQKRIKQQQLQSINHFPQTSWKYQQTKQEGEGGKQPGCN